MQPLEGIRVIDVSQVQAGPFCAMMLGDLGADIIKIEEPGIGDPTRTQGPFLQGESSGYLGLNRNKRSVSVNLRHPKGQKLVQDMVKQADVFLENSKPGVMERLNLGYEKLSALNARLIYCSISGWGSDGPYADRPGFAMTAEAVAGVMSLTGEPGGEPMRIGYSLLDPVGAVFAFGGIVSALYARERTGKGQKVETSLLEAAVATLIVPGYAYLCSGQLPKRMGTEHEWNVPIKSYKTKDSYIMLVGWGARQWQKCCEALGIGELADDPRLKTPSDRANNRDIINNLIQEKLLTRSTAEWDAIFTEAGVACAPICNLAEVFSHPQVLHRQMLTSLDHPKLGKVPQIGMPVKYSETPGEIRRHPPGLGEHTEEVLRELLHLLPDEIAALRGEEAI